MDLIPIPHEVAEIKTSTHLSLANQIKLNLDQKRNSHGDKILNRTYQKMAEHLTSEKFDNNKTDSLIMDMQRSIIHLQKKKRANLPKRKRR